MQKFKLTLENREQKTPNQLRREGKIPATVYGRGVPSKSVQVNAKEFSHLPHAAFSHVIELDGGQHGSTSALVRQVQRRATTHQVLNVEFYQVQADRKLTVRIPLKFIGTSPAIKLGGQLVEFHQEVEVECLPKDIPDCIEVDLAQIVELDQGIHFAALVVPKSVEILNPPDEIVVRISTPRAGVGDSDKQADSGSGEAAASAAEKG
jgi:large subunit ribosomal protein L25